VIYELSGQLPMVKKQLLVPLKLFQPSNDQNSKKEEIRRKFLKRAIGTLRVFLNYLVQTFLMGLFFLDEWIGLRETRMIQTDMCGSIRQFQTDRKRRQYATESLEGKAYILYFHFLAR